MSWTESLSHFFPNAPKYIPKRAYHRCTIFHSPYYLSSIDRTTMKSYPYRHKERLRTDLKESKKAVDLKLKSLMYSLSLHTDSQNQRDGLQYVERLVSRSPRRCFLVNSLKLMIHLEILCLSLGNRFLLGWLADDPHYMFVSNASLMRLERKKADP